MMTRFLTPLVALALLIGGACGYAALAPCSGATQKARALGLPVGAASCPVAAGPATTAETAPAPPPPPEVTVARAERREFVDRLFVSGTLMPREEAQVAARIDGLTIVELDAEDGDWVKAGQVLARLDRTQLDALLAQNDADVKRADAAIEQAKSNIAQAQAQVKWTSDDFGRAQKLAGGVMSVSTVEQRETALKTAEAQLAAANHALSVAEADRKARDAERQELDVRIGRAEVTAPVSGLVSRRSAKLGATASGAGEPLFRIIVDGAVDLEADAPEQSLIRFAVGMPATIRLPGVADPVHGEVRLISQEVEKASRTGKVCIALSDVSHAHIGAFASAEVELERSDGISAPAAALEREGDVARLYVVRDGKIEERKVTPGVVDGDEVEIKNGLDAGETVVAKAAAFLRPGDRVRPAPARTSIVGG
jgi:RND family efflux transporter MFP subunit